MIGVSICNTGGRLEWFGVGIHTIQKLKFYNTKNYWLDGLRSFSRSIPRYLKKSTNSDDCLNLA